MQSTYLKLIKLIDHSRRLLVVMVPNACGILCCAMLMLIICIYVKLELHHCETSYICNPNVYT